MEIKKGLSFKAYQYLGSGREGAVQVMRQYYPVKDERLANIEIPMGEEPQKYIADCERSLKLLDAGVIPILPDENVSPRSDKKQGEVLQPVFARMPKGKNGICGVANFMAIPVCKKVYVDAEGKEYVESESFEVDITIDGRRMTPFEIKTSDIGNIVKLIKKRYSFADVNYNVDDAEKIIESDFRRRTAQIRTKRVLYEAGWQRVDGSWRYVRDGYKLGMDTVVATGKKLPCYYLCDKKIAGQYFWDMLNITRDRNTNYVMVLFSLLGILYRPMEIAGITPRFTLFVNGKSGAMKSSLAKILFTQLASDEHRKTLRRIDADTLVSFERAIVENGRDTTLLFDDYAPAKTVQQKNEMQNKLEKIIRMVGDGATKSRSNAKLADLKGKGVRGVVAVTGELKGKGLSSNLRCIYVEMKKGSVYTTKLAYFQKNEDAYSTALSYFADFIECNWGSVVEVCKVNTEHYRMMFSEKIKEPRIVDNAIVLQLAADIFKEFMIKWGGFSCDIAGLERTKMTNAIMEIAQQNEKMTEVESYSEMFVQSIATLMTEKEIILHNEKLTEEDLVSFDGFYDEEHFYFIPDKVYAKCVRYIQQIGQFLPFDMKEMSAELYHDGFIKSFSNGKNHKTYFCRLKVSDSMKANFWKMKKELFIKIVNGD